MNPEHPARTASPLFARYLDELTRRTAHLPADERSEIIEDVADHLDEVTAGRQDVPTDEAQAALNRLGTVDEIVEATEEPTQRSTSHTTQPTLPPSGSPHAVTASPYGQWSVLAGGFGVLLSWFVPIVPFIFGCAGLFYSTRALRIPSQRRQGQWGLVLVAIIVAVPCIQTFFGGASSGSSTVSN